MGQYLYGSVRLLFVLFLLMELGPAPFSCWFHFTVALSRARKSGIGSACATGFQV
jgi:hypothetical protein